MTADTSSTQYNRVPPINASWNLPGQEAYDQLSGLADKIGTAYSEAYELISAAYAEASQKLASEVDGLQEKLSDRQGATFLITLTDPSSATARRDEAQVRLLALGESLADMAVEIGLAYVDASEQAAFAVAKCHEQIGVVGQFDLLKVTTAARADLLRKVARGSARTIREMAA